MDNERRRRLIINRLIQRIFEGRIYHFNRRNPITNVIYVRCKYARLGCRGSGKITPAGVFEVINPTHNCGAPQMNIDLEEQFLNSLRNLCSRQLRDVAEIYNEVIILYPEMRQRKPLQDVRANMLRWQRQAHLPHVNTYNEFGRTLGNRRFENLLNHSFGTMTVNTTVTSATFGDRLLTNEVSDGDEANLIYIGNSKKMLSENNILNSINLLTFINPYKKHGIPTGWAILSEDNEDTYSRIFDYYFDVIGAALEPLTIYTNFNKHLHLALRQKLLNVNIKTLFMPYFLDNVHNATINNLDINDEHVKRNLKKIISIALLPPEIIPQAFLTLKELIWENHGDMYEDFLIYYRETWIREVGPTQLSFFEDLGAFKNAVEGHWRKIEFKMQNANDIWDLTRLMHKHQVGYHQDIQKLNARNRNTSKVVHITEVIRKKHLINIWGSWNRNEVCIDRFLENASTLLDSLLEDVIFRQEMEGLNDEQYIVGEDRHNYDDIILEREMERDPVENQNQGNVIENHNVMNVNEAVEDEIGELGNDILDYQLEAAEVNLPLNDYIVYDGICLLCEMAPVQIRFQPCRHVAMCQPCAEHYRQHRRNNNLAFLCIICQREVDIELM